ncbi:hypothetical protein [Methylicorpusculum sp.]|uniref:hypothetical protein n=1 Tax=Methylicorpusculum sp. TaxID=2713644 RepID=UPI002ABAF9E6|nr:hypothetical protein [Methylicorpusculum sp.]MDZ4151331.1 hypothetical protein [Methylicorpusculum sp.]
MFTNDPIAIRTNTPELSDNLYALTPNSMEQESPYAVTPELSETSDNLDDLTIHESAPIPELTPTLSMFTATALPLWQTQLQDTPLMSPSSQRAPLLPPLEPAAPSPETTPPPPYSEQEKTTSREQEVFLVLNIINNSSEQVTVCAEYTQRLPRRNGLPPLFPYFYSYIKPHKTELFSLHKKNPSPKLKQLKEITIFQGKNHTQKLHPEDFVSGKTLEITLHNPWY